MTSAEEFPEETPVPPAVLDNPTAPVGAIWAIDKDKVSNLRLGITVRDENLDDVLQVQARLSVGGEPPYDFVCPLGTINPTNMPTRDVFEVPIETQKLKVGLCTRVEVVVSQKFSGGCMGIPSEGDDSAHANYWIWEMSRMPAMNPAAAQVLLTSCQTVTSAQGTPTSMVQ